MKLMLASFDTGPVLKNVGDLMHLSKYVLGSFWYLQKGMYKELEDLVIQRNEEDNFMLDSGAFTMIMSKTQTVNLDEYVEQYIAFINKYDIKRFIELDIDQVVGYEKVIQIRNQIERETGKKVVPAYHRWRGMDNFKQMVDEYEYVAFGGFNNSEYTSEDTPLIKDMIKYAKRNGVKVHGLGYTRSDLPEWGWYSVDSSSWKIGSRFGQAVTFDGKKLQKIDKPTNAKINPKLADRNNFIEWCKFQRYVEQF